MSPFPLTFRAFRVFRGRKKPFAVIVPRRKLRVGRPENLRRLLPEIHQECLVDRVGGRRLFLLVLFDRAPEVVGDPAVGGPYRDTILSY